MIKSQTGITFTPAEFRKLNTCLSCGKASDIKKGKQCDSCMSKNLQHCDMCEIILRNGEIEYYSYDIKDDFRIEELDFKASKELVKEFKYTETENNPIRPDLLCSVCVNWESRMKNKCWDCGCNFINNKLNYKLNGNMCRVCADYLDNKNVKKTNDNKFVRESLCDCTS